MKRLYELLWAVLFPRTIRQISISEWKRGMKKLKLGTKF